MNDEPHTNDPAPVGLPPADTPKKGIGLMGWLLFLGVLGLFLYGRFFGGAPC